MVSDHKNGDDSLRSWVYKNQRTDGDVNRHCRLISRSECYECTTSDLMLFQYQLNCADSTKTEHYSICAD